MLSDEARYHILRKLEASPELSQRQLGLGKVNCCLRALAEKGMLKVRNFTNS
jgi:hypothetical protein